MLTVDPKLSTLLVVDFQAKLMPAIDQGDAAIANARRLLDAAAMIGIPTPPITGNRCGPLSRSTAVDRPTASLTT